MSLDVKSEAKHEAIVDAIVDAKYDELASVSPDQVDGVLSEIFRRPGGKMGRDKMFAHVKRRYTGISRRRIMRFLRQQETWQLHQPATSGLVVHQPQAVLDASTKWQMDLIDLKRLSRYNNRKKWILTVIDTFTKYAWTAALPCKSAACVARALQAMFDGLGG
jgi:hypothetical protein